jgi:general stress protein 26
MPEDKPMNKLNDLETDARKTLFDTMDDVPSGMLGVVGSDQHMQPMTHFADRDLAEVWFITSKATDLVRAVGQGARAQYCLASGNGDFFACLAGTIEQSTDSAKLDELWSPVASAWFDEGREDPDVCLLKLTLLDAGVWATTDSTAAFGLEIARANLQSSHKPDLGRHCIVRFGAEG